MLLFVLRMKEGRRGEGGGPRTKPKPLNCGEKSSAEPGNAPCFDQKGKQNKDEPFNCLLSAAFETSFNEGKHN